MKLEASLGTVTATLDLAEAARWDDERLLASERGEGRRFAVWPIMITSPERAGVLELDVDDGPRNAILDEDGGGDIAVLGAILRAARAALETAVESDADMLDALLSGAWARRILPADAPGIAKANVAITSATPQSVRSP